MSHVQRVLPASKKAKGAARQDETPLLPSMALHGGHFRRRLPSSAAYLNPTSWRQTRRRSLSIPKVEKIVQGDSSGGRL